MCVCVGGVRSDGEGKIFLTEKMSLRVVGQKNTSGPSWEINFWKFNETLTNNVVSFDQPGPVL